MKLRNARGNTCAVNEPRSSGVAIARIAGALVAVALATIALVSAGCGTAPKGPTPLATSDRTMLPRLNVYPGEPVVYVLAEPWTGAGPIALAEDGTPLAAELRRVFVEVPFAARGEGARADDWQSPPGQWRTEAALASSARLDLPLALRGRDAVVVAIPPDLDGRLVRIAGIVMVASVLPLEVRLPRVEKGSSLEDPWRPLLENAAADDLALLARVRIEAQSPLTRWRYRLLMDGLHPDATVSRGVLAPEAFGDASIELLAIQNERRWRVGLARLWAASADLSSRVRHRLAAVVDFGNGVRAPAWPTDHALMDDLLDSLLDVRLTPAQVVQRASRWLEEMPAAAAWVVDDAGVLPANGTRPLPTLGIVNFGDRATLAWAEWDGLSSGDGAAPEPRTLGPRSAVLTVLGGEQADVARAVAHAGEWSVSLPVISGVRATPPGLTMAPFGPDHAMDSWQRGEVRSLRAEWTTAAILQRVPASRAGPPGWEVLVECRLPEGLRSRSGGEAIGAERIELWFGEPGPRARGVIVHEDGRVERRPTPIKIEGEFDVAPEQLRTLRTPSGWSVRVPLPAGLISNAASGGVDEGSAREGASARRALRMGLVRVDLLGRRSAWPRPMMPWQEQPGRALIDVAAWDE
jgi:hypothetical protein